MIGLFAGATLGRMHLHPEVSTALIAQHERDLLRRSEEHGLLPRRERLVEPIRLRRRRLGLLDSRWA